MIFMSICAHAQSAISRTAVRQRKKISRRPQKRPKPPVWVVRMLMNRAQLAKIVMAFATCAAIGLSFNASAQESGLGTAGELVDPDVLRVCSDPSNLPFSDDKGKGFEN